ncbi:hypothetical protein QYE76_061988 [Lolium multiflorum]|uniref:DUF8039 domain-containing protein n=1 Tax=Lolium multiflorum TaxID=4521 RepID=A0AAD8S367_LOLMU|nr:hypothetical protein QYE76_061988 [Lolium multiflorum]
MKRKYIQMSMLIQGPTQPGNDINMYLELLKEELETLWAEEGVDTWDAVAEEYFPLRAALITTVQDYLGYGYISCQVCHGHKACVRCMEETMFLQLGKDPGSSKTVYMGHRRWLQKTDPWRKRGDLFDGTNEPRGPPRKKSGEEIDTLLKGWKECPPPGKIRQKPGEKKKKKATVTTPLIGVWKRRSVFWDLPYWKILDTPHCLDVMHITKNVCESLLGTLLNMPDRTKDGPKARHDLKVLGIREELQIPAAQEGQSEEEADGGQKRKRIKQPDYYCPPSCFTFSPAEVDQFFNCLLGVRVPFGYSGLISRYMDPKKRNFSGMKSHDRHVMMTQILPVATNWHVSSERSSISTRRTSELRAKRLCEPSSLRALLKFTKHLSSYKYMVRKLIAEGKGFEEVHSAFPHVSQADFDAFVANEELQATKNRKLWGKEMRELNIGNHNLGSRGYEGKEPYWAKEDEAYVNAGIENPWLKYKDPLERRFIRSRYHKKKLTGELVTDPKVVTDIIWFTNDKKVLALEKKLEEERQKLSQCDEGSSSQASTGRVAWDKPLVRALNIVNEHSPTRRPHRGRVAGAGTGYKHGHYGLSSADDKNARSERKQREAEEMRESILAEVQAGLVPQLVPQLKATLVPEVKAEVAASVQADFNALHAWYEGGKQAPPKMQVVSFDGSNSMAPPSAGNDNVIMETPPAAGNVAGARDSPSMPGSSPSVTCTPAAACAGPSTLAELNALTALSTPCTFLMRVNGELKDVARGSILRPLDKKWHTRDMEDDVYRVEVDRALPGYEDLFPPNQPHGADDEDPLNLASLKGWVSVPPRQPAAPVVSAPPQRPAAPVVSAPPQQPAAPVVSAPPQQPAAPEAEEYEREDFQWDIPMSSQVVHEDAPAPKFGCSKKLFDSQETAEEENPEEVAAVAVKKMLSPNTLRATVTAEMVQDMYCTLIVVHPQHSHASISTLGRDKKKDYTNIRALLNDALPGFANKAGPLKVERKSRGGLVLTHTTNFPCLRQSKQDNGMDAWYAILRMQDKVRR